MQFIVHYAQLHVNVEFLFIVDSDKDVLVQVKM